MRFLIICILLLLNMTSFGRNTGKNYTSSDSIKEVIVYEYDTIYLAPDTIKSIDTIYSYQVKKFEWSFGAGISLKLTDFGKETYPVDSFSVRNRFYPIPDFYLSCRDNKNIYSLRMGILSLNQNLLSQRARYVLKGNPNDYDSLVYTTKCNAENQYTFLKLSLGYGKIWKRNALSYGCNLFCTVNYLIDKNAAVKNTLPDKTIFQLEMNPFVGMKLTKNLEVYVRPFYQFVFQSKKNIPYQNPTVLGVSCNISVDY